MVFENYTLPDLNITINNTTNTTFSRNEDLARVEVFIQLVIFILAVLGNTTVLVSLYRKRKSLTRMHHLMIHLSLADLFVAFGSVLPQMAWDITYVFKGGDFLCKLVKYMQIVAIYASAYVLVMTAIDRYFAICLPLTSHKWSTTTVRKMIVTAWTLSLIFSIPQLFIFSYKLNRYGMYDCWGTFEPEWTLTLYITMFTVLVYIIPTLILIFCYTSICLIVWRSGKIGEKLAAMPNPIPLQVIKRDGEGTMGSHSNLNLSSSANPLIFNAKDNGDKSSGKKFHVTDTSLPRGEISHVYSPNSSLTINGRVSPKGRGSFPRSPYTDRRCTGQDATLRSPYADRRYIAHDISPQSPPSERRFVGHGISRAKIRTIKLTLTVVICYLACWSPFFIAQMWAVYDTNAPFYGAAYTIILLLASLNSCTNPWIYLIFSESFVSGFKQTSLTLTRAIRCQ